MRRAALVLAVLGVALGTGLYLARSRDATQRRRGQIIAEAMTPLLSDEAFRERTRGHTPEQVQALSFELSREGLARLPDERLVARMDLMGRAVASAEPPTCAALFRGTGRGAPLRGDLLAGFDDEALRAWMELSRDAVLASLRGDPAARPEPRASQSVLQQLLETLPTADADRLAADLRTLGALPDQEACWAGRTLFAASAKLSDADRRVLARALVTE